LQFDTLENEQGQQLLEEIILHLKAIIEKESDNFEAFLRQNEITSMKRKYEEGIANILEDAKRRKAGIFTNSMPWWVYVLLIFFGYDDIIRLVFSKWLVVVLLIGSTFFILHKLNLSHIPRNLYYDIDSFVSRTRNRLFSRR
jgi:hypothetical protein